MSFSSASQTSIHRRRSQRSRTTRRSSTSTFIGEWSASQQGDHRDTLEQEAQSPPPSPSPSFQAGSSRPHHRRRRSTLVHSQSFEPDPDEHEHPQESYELQDRSHLSEPIPTPPSPSIYTTRTSFARTSTSTLVNAPPSLNLIFDRNSVINATLYSRAGPQFVIKTNRSVTSTVLQDARADLDDSVDPVLATWKRREFLPDKIRFTHRERGSMRLGRWLRKRKMAKREREEWDATTRIRALADLKTEHGRFTWRSDRRYRLALFPAEQTTNINPIAYVRVLGEPTTLALVIRDPTFSNLNLHWPNDRRPNPRHIHIEIIMSFLVMEQRLRMKEKRMGNVLYGPFGGQFIMVG